MEFGTPLTFKVPIVHFWVPPGLCFKTWVGAQPLIWKSFFMLMQIKLIFTTKVVHLASFWKWGFLELRSGLFSSSSTCDEFNCIFWALKTVTFEISTVWIFSLRIDSYNPCYYSFKTLLRFWLAKSTRIIHHNQLLMTKFGRILRKWRQKCSVLAG